MKYFVQAWTNLSPSGRVSRKEYWMFVLFHCIFSFLLVVAALLVSELTGYSAYLTMILPSIFVIVVAVPAITMQIKRLHDSGKSGWWILLSFIPYIGFVVLLVFYVQPSAHGPNKYGSPPIAQTQKFRVEEYEQMELVMPESVEFKVNSTKEGVNHKVLKIVAVVVVCAALSTLFYCIGSEFGHEDDYAIKYEEGREAGYHEGYNQGYNDGQEDGYYEGYESGKESGYQNGYDDCWTSEDYIFYRENAVIVTTEGEKYHYHNCPFIKNREYSYWIYNIELAEAKGYEPCLNCIGLE